MDDLTLFASRHRDVLVRHARRMGFSREDAEDLAHSVWAVFLERPDQFAGRSSLGTFLVGILRNKAKETWRRNKRGAAVAPEASDSASNEMEASILQREQVRLAQDCIEELGPDMKRVVEHELSGTSKETAARRLAIPLSRLYVILHRARHHLFDCMHAAT